MRRTSLTPEQAKQLADIFRTRRMKLGFSMRQVATKTGFDIATVVNLEAATNLSPLPGTLRAIARVLELSISDLFVIADWLPAGELPTLRPYLRAKYHDLDEGAIAELERYADRLIKRRGGHGPIGHEDEQP
jgi:transcriptional regulator with XRE-family HTH domain